LNSASINDLVFISNQKITNTSEKQAKLVLFDHTW